MIIIGISVLLFSLPVIIIAWRGRVIARGQFCRKCRFDLAGLNLESSDSKCPECGGQIHQSHARRLLLRKKSRLGLSIAVIMVLAGAASIWIGASGKTSFLMGVMPESVVLWLTDQGVDGALDELVVRVSQVPSDMSLEGWEHAIESGLVYQADTTITWDVRWGEVLFQGLDHAQFNDDQLERYFLNASEIDLTVRDRVRRGKDGVGYQLSSRFTRFAMLTGGTINYQISQHIVSYGVVGEESVMENELFFRRRRMENELLLRRRGGRAIRLNPYFSGPTKRETTKNMAQYFGKEVGEIVHVFLEYEVELLTMTEDEPVFTQRVRKEFEVQIIHEDELIVRTYKDDSAAQLAIHETGIKSIRVIKDLENRAKFGRIELLATQIRSDVEIAQLSLEVFLLFEGQEIQIDKIARVHSRQNLMGIVVWRVKEDESEAYELAKAAHAQVIEDQKATIIVRTNPQLIERIPGVDRVLDVDFKFVDVPVVIVESFREMIGPALISEREQTKGQPLDD